MSSNSNRKRKKSPEPTNPGRTAVTKNNLQQQLIVQRAQTTSNQTNTAGGQQNQQVIQTTNSAERQTLVQEIAEKRRTRAIIQPENLHLLDLIDPATNLTNTDVLMLRWQKDYIFGELKGIVVFVKRAPTSKNGWDRGDLILEIGQQHEKERVAVFGWNEYAGILETANLNDVVVMRNLIVVPEDSVRVKWSGSIEFKLKFVKGSTMNIEGRGQINVNQDAVISRGGPSTSTVAAAVPRPNSNTEILQLVDRASNSINNGSNQDPEIEYDFTDL
uniref:Uncharacterized protein n=3 Tax=Meloidogyne TaxID=189290 RepID=A0A6V7X231_MELEN|nr:unnamed protein product [Meloidogyne enterolobii]